MLTNSLEGVKAFFLAFGTEYLQFIAFEIDSIFEIAASSFHVVRVD